MSKKNLSLIIVLLIIAVAIAGFIYYQKTKPAPALISAVVANPLITMSSRQLVDQCTTDLVTKFHIHPHLAIIANKHNIELPANIGIDLAKDCMSSVHTHDNTGIIHIEAPIQKDFTLGDFFYKWNQPLTSTQFMNLPLDSSHALKVYVDQHEVTQPENIILKDKQSILIDYYSLADGPDPLPAPYTWPNGYSD